MVVGVKTRLNVCNAKYIKNILASTIPGDSFGGPAGVEKVIRVEMVEIGAKMFFLASTIPGDHSGGPA